MPAATARHLDVRTRWVTAPSRVHMNSHRLVAVALRSACAGAPRAVLNAAPRTRPPSIRNRPYFHERSNPPLSGRTVRRRIGSDRANPNTAGPNLLRPWGSKLEDGVRPLSTLSSSARTSLAGRRRHPDAARAATSQIRLHTAIARSASAEPIRCLQRPGRTVSDRSRPEGGAGYTPERNPASWLAG